MPFFAVEYSITRAIHWRHITALSYGGAFVVIIFLTILNVALVGYETINVFQDNFNATQDLWFHRFLPYGKPQPGTLCEPHLLSIGDHFKVGGSEVDWTILSITANRSISGLPYTGSILSSACDVTRIVVSEKYESSLREILVVLECWNLNGVYMNASAPLLSPTITSTGPLRRLLRDVQPGSGDTSQFLNSICDNALLDVCSGFSKPYDIEWLFLTATFRTPCLANATSMACGREVTVPGIDALVNWAWKVPGNSATYMSMPAMTHEIPLDPYVLGGHVSGQSDLPGQRSIWNLLQTIYALVRIELVDDSPNNFLLHSEALSMVLFKNINLPGTAKPQGSDLYMLVEGALRGQIYNSLGESMFNASRGSTYNTSRGSIEGAYLCKQQHLKSPGNLFVSVLVAVLSMFTGIWTVYMWILSTLAKQSRGANTCVTHSDPSYHSLDSLETAVVGLESREEQAKWIELMQLGYDLNRRRYERRPSFVADEIVLTSLPHTKHC